MQQETKRPVAPNCATAFLRVKTMLPSPISRESSSHRYEFASSSRLAQDCGNSCEGAQYKKADQACQSALRPTGTVATDRAERLVAEALIVAF